VEQRPVSDRYPFDCFQGIPRPRAPSCQPGNPNPNGSTEKRTVSPQRIEIPRPPSRLTARLITAPPSHAWAHPFPPSPRPHAPRAHGDGRCPCPSLSPPLRLHMNPPHPFVPLLQRTLLTSNASRFSSALPRRSQHERTARLQFRRQANNNKQRQRVRGKGAGETHGRVAVAPVVAEAQAAGDRVLLLRRGSRTRRRGARQVAPACGGGRLPLRLTELRAQLRRGGGRRRRGRISVQELQRAAAALAGVGAEARAHRHFLNDTFFFLSCRCMIH
jgi:hypothetical protein